jgi:ribosomal protein S18 acetylase RimI-like enzyme
MIEILSLKDTGIDELYNSFNSAFKDYDRTWTREEFELLLKRRGYKADISFGAFYEGKLVSFTLNGSGTFMGKRTAYDTGTGTIETYRRTGLATQIFKVSEPVLKELGYEQYLLEVLQHNTKAVSVYRQIGFNVHRELNYFLTDKRKVAKRTKELPEGIQIRRIDKLMMEEMEAMWDFTPSWQNSFEALSRDISDFVILGAYRGERLVGYGIQAPERRKGIGSTIIQHLLPYITHNNIKVLNTDKADSGITSFIEYNQIPYLGSQYEMLLQLPDN